MTAVLTIEKATHDMSGVTFTDATHEYDGTEKVLEIGGVLPEGVSVTYENNRGTDAGTYPAVAKFEVADPENYNLIPDMTATLTITKKAGTIVITNKDALSKIYNGEAVSEPIIETTGDGAVTVEYYVGSEASGDVLETAPVNVGTYTVKVILEETNNYMGATDSATFEITKATYDMSGITFTDATYP